MKLNSRLFILPALVAGLQAATAGDITGTVKLSGTPPPEIVNEKIKNDPFCGKQHSEPVKTQFYVVGANSGLKDVVVMLVGPGLDGKSTGASAAPLVMDQKGCEYLPYVSAVQTHQKIMVKNSDATMHNVHPTPMTPGNKEENKAQMAGGPDLTFAFDKPENFLRFKCDVHDWMLSYVTVVDHPYFAVTDKDGSFKIANVPPGKYTIEAIHRKANLKKPVTQEVEVKPDGAKVDFTIEVPKVQ